LLEALKQNRFALTAAFWYYFVEPMEWRLVLVSPTVDRAGPLSAYKRVQRVLARIDPAHLTLSDISVVGPSSQDYRDLAAGVSSSSRFGAGPAAHQAHTPHTLVLEDAYVYQV
jgi:hypothetical protein